MIKSFNLFGVRVLPYVISIVICISCIASAATTPQMNISAQITSVELDLAGNLTAKVKGFDRTFYVNQESYDSCKPTCFLNKLPDPKYSVQKAFLEIAAFISGFLGFFLWLSQLDF